MIRRRSKSTEKSLHFLVLIFIREGGDVSWIILLTVHYWYVGVVYIYCWFGENSAKISEHKYS